MSNLDRFWHTKQGIPNCEKCHQTAIDTLFDKHNLSKQRKRPACFAAGTLVHTENGLVPIEQIKVGDKVLSRGTKEDSCELVFKPVINTIVTKNIPVSLLELSIAIDSDLPIGEQLKLHRLSKKQPKPRLLITNNHPVWIENKGWIQAKDVKPQDSLTSKEAISYSAQSGNNPYTDTSLRSIYKTNKDNVGFIPYAEYDSSIQKGSLVNLSTGNEIKGNVTYKSVLDKLYKDDPDWKKRLLEQTPEEHRDHAEFFGFRQGEWRAPDTVEWGKGEGPLTMTVYNLEVEDTHTYFVGEAGIWVHNCGGEEDCVGYRCVWRTRQTRVNKTKKEKEL